MDQHLIDDLKQSYGLVFHHAEPINFGYMHQKWQVSTNRGDFLVKRFSHKRYDRARLVGIERALQRQFYLWEQGLPCPEILLFEGQPIRYLDAETSYMVMAFALGEMKGPDSVTPAQLYDLGQVCGKIQRLLTLREGQIHSDDLQRYLQRSDPQSTLSALRETFEIDLPDGVSEDYKAALLAAKPLAEQVTLSYLERLPRGLAHEDFAADNLLFDEKDVTAVVDFDQSGPGYLWHDLGRAALCFCLQDGQFDLKKAAALAEGYRSVQSLPAGAFADAVRVTWCIEAAWWIKPCFFGDCSGKTKRFREEVVWVGENWGRLDAMLGNI